MSTAVANVDHYVAAFEETAARLPGAGLPWLEEFRRQGLSAFERLGFPTTRQEDWKYTSVRPIERERFALAGESCVGLAEDDLGAALMTDLEAHRFVFVNGRHAPQLSRPGTLPEGVTALPLAEALGACPDRVEALLGRRVVLDESGFAGLNAAYFTDGLFLEVEPGVELVHPIHVLHVAVGQSEPAAHHLRHLVLLGEGARTVFIEHYIALGGGAYLDNVVTELALQPHARLRHYKLLQEGADGHHIASVDAHQLGGSHYRSHNVCLGGRLVRNDIRADLDAEYAECELFGLYVTDGRQHVDNHTRVDHRRPHGTSHEFYKGVLAGRSRAVFNGVVYVHPGAQKTDAQQANHNLLLSREAEIDTKPQLEIYADDVKCSHGATVGQLDENQMFYLRSRGIPEATAAGMLTYGFAHDLVEHMGLEPVRHLIEEVLVRKLPHAADLQGAG
jgi:Fe-S cluster assembly protein SufD